MKRVSFCIVPVQIKTDYQIGIVTHVKVLFKTHH